MGSAFVSTKPVKIQVESKPGQWIEIKAKLGAGDRQHVQDMGLVVSSEGAGDGASYNVSVHMARMTMAILRVSIVGWRLNDDDGAQIKFDPALIDQLDMDDELVQAVMEATVEKNPTWGTKTSEEPTETGNES